jgi:hypothetical protein
MSDNVNKILKLQKQLGNLKEEQIAAKSRRDVLLENLKKTFGCSSVEEATDKLASLEKDLTVLQKKLNKDIEAFEEAYPL